MQDLFYWTDNTKICFRIQPLLKCMYQILVYMYLTQSIETVIISMFYFYSNYHMRILETLLILKHPFKFTS